MLEDILKVNDKDVIEKIYAPRFREKGYVLISEEEFYRLKNTHVAKPQKSPDPAKKRPHKIAFECWGIKYESFADAERRTGINSQKLNYAYHAGTLEKIIPKPPEELKLTAESVDKNGIVTRIRKRK